MGKIYTKKGDDGTTGNLRGRMRKSDQLAVTLGTIDELNSWIGYCRQLFTDKELQRIAERIQDNLMTISSGLAGGKLRISGSEVVRLERMIDKYSEKLPAISNFIYPSGPVHVARAVARRAEREVTKTAEATKVTLRYMNRLSDALFVIARKENLSNNISEKLWRK